MNFGEIQNVLLFQYAYIFETKSILLHNRTEIVTIQIQAIHTYKEYLPTYLIFVDVSLLLVCDAKRRKSRDLAKSSKSKNRHRLCLFFDFELHRACLV